MVKRFTKKEIKQSFSRIYSLGYCGFSDIVSRLKLERNGYSSGYYGWRCDYYFFGPVAVSTGYDPIGNFSKELDELNQNHAQYTDRELFFKLLEILNIKISDLDSASCCCIPFSKLLEFTQLSEEGGKKKKRKLVPKME